MHRLDLFPGKPSTTRVAAGWVLFFGLAGALTAAGATDVTTMSLEQLLDLRVVGASKYAQKQSEVAAAVSIITRDEFGRLDGAGSIRRWPRCRVSTPPTTVRPVIWARAVSACRAM
jgi:hypothetical protein